MNELAEPQRPALRIGFGSDRRWLAVFAALTIIELDWWGLAWRAGIAPAPLVGTYLLLGFGGLAAALSLRLALCLRSPDAPWTAVIAGTLLVAVSASVFLPLKYAIPSESPFWLDQPLASVERTFFGSDPWLILDRVLGWVTKPMDWLYGCWLPTQLLVMFSVMLGPPSRQKDEALIAYSLAWFLLGVVGAVLLSSAGPLFYDRAFGGTEFAPLADSLRTRGAWVAIAESDRMWASTSMARPGLVAGISAMPSIHVAISLWMVLTARTMAPRLAWPAAVYFILIWVGSVQLGWHYASDGLVGALGVCGVWWSTRLLIADRQPPRLDY
jgi:hypothetical protein